MRTRSSDERSNDGQLSSSADNELVAQARTAARLRAELRAKLRAALVLTDAERRSWATVVDREFAPPQTHERFVYTSYRPHLPSLGLCLRSMFAWHNATLSIWSSLLLVALNLYLGLDCARAVRAAGGTENCARGFVLQGGMRAACWLFSWAYHTFAPHSPAVANMLLGADYGGCIGTVIIVGNNLLLQLIGPGHQFGSAALVLCGWAVFAGVVSTNDESVGVHRGLLLGGAVMVVSVIAATLAGDSAAALLPLLLTAVAFEAAGAAVFFLCVPERWFPRNRMVDCLANSHALWHLANVGFDLYTFRFAMAAFIVHVVDAQAAA